MIEIEVCERLMDYKLVPIIEDGKVVDSRRVPTCHAQLKGQPGLWGSGPTIAAAVGDLIGSHPEIFGIAVEFVGTRGR